MLCRTIQILCLCVLSSTSGPLYAQLTSAHLANSILPVQVFTRRSDAPVITTGVVVRADGYSGYIITTAEQLGNDKQLRVSLPHEGGGLVARIVATDAKLNLALLKVGGLDLPALVFSRAPGVKGQPVWSAVPWGSEKQTIGFAQGSLSTVSGIDEPLAHSAVVGSPDNGSVLLNSCGEILGYSSGQISGGDQIAVNARIIDNFLSRHGLRTMQATDPCVSQLAVARQQVNLAIEAAERAQSDAVNANKEAQALGEQIAQANQRNQLLAEEATIAQSAAAAAIEVAEHAQYQANQARLGLEEQTVLFASNTQAMADQDELNRLASEQRFDKALLSQRKAAEEREERMLITFTMVAIVLVVLVFLLQRFVLPRPRLTNTEAAKSAHLPEKNEKVEKEQKAATRSQYVLDGRDEEGLRHMVSIPVDDLESVDGVVIGRSKAASPFSINHVDVSRRHARVKLLEDQVFIEDLGSTNGTSVNGQTIDEKGLVRLAGGDQIIIGSVVMKLRLTDA